MELDKDKVKADYLKAVTLTEQAENAVMAGTLVYAANILRDAFSKPSKQLTEAIELLYAMAAGREAENPTYIAAHVTNANAEHKRTHL